MFTFKCGYIELDDTIKICSLIVNFVITTNNVKTFGATKREQSCNLYVAKLTLDIQQQHNLIKWFFFNVFFRFVTSALALKNIKSKKLPLT